MYFIWSKYASQEDPILRHAPHIFTLIQICFSGAQFSQTHSTVFILIQRCSSTQCIE
jgi:hypothetical protein